MKKIIFVLISSIIFTGYSFAAFNVIDTSARAMGMGNAFCGVADDINCLIDNPSGVANIKTWEATFTGSKLNWGISNMGEGFAAVAMPIKGMGGFGIGWYNFTDTLYFENIFYLAYSYPIPFFKNSAIAISGKYLTKGYVANEWTAINPLFTSSDMTSAAISLGASLITTPFEGVSVGLFFDDINQPNVGSFDVEQLPMSIRGGIKYIYDKFTLLSTELYYDGTDYKWFLGGENKAFVIKDFGNILLRLGGGLGTSSYMNLTLGLGCDFKFPITGVAGQFDYGFEYPLGFATGNGGTHRVTLTIMGITAKDTEANEPVKETGKNKKF